MTSNRTNYFREFFCGLALVALVACGGGGGVHARWGPIQEALSEFQDQDDERRRRLRGDL